MTAISKLLTDNIGFWVEAVKPKASAGRGSGSSAELYGVKKLRELILDLAVRGMLVPQNSSDGTAEQLLNDVALQKTRLVQDKALGKRRSFPQIDLDAVPYKLPDSWEWSRIEDIGRDWGQKIPEAEFTYVDVGSINSSSGRIENPGKLLPDQAPSRARKIVKKGTVIYSTVRPYLLNIAIVTESFRPEPIASTAFAVVHPLNGISGDYLYRYLRSPIFVKYVESVQTGVAYPAINDKQFFSALIAIPPAAEQHRIVAKVDELMALCDKLEAQQADAIEAHKALVTTVLDALTTATEKESFDTAWARIAEHFDTLFTAEWSVDQLEKSILQLAVTGRLSKVSDSDEPSRILIQRVLTERDRLIEEEKLRTRASDQMASGDRYLSVPESWSWCRLGNLAKFIDYRGRTPKKTESGVRLITAKNVRFGYIDLNPEEFISETEYVSWMTRGFPRVGDLLFTPEAPLGHVAEIGIKEKFALAQRAICFQLHEPSMSKYLRLVIMSPSFQEQLVDKASGMTATGIKAAKLKEIPIPIPSADEQARIVAKVDELLAVCDALKSAIRETQQTQLLLADAITEQAVA